MAEFQKGDVVKLKSGGPDTMVEGAGAAKDSVNCCWFDDKNQYIQRTFDAAMLKKVGAAPTNHLPIGDDF